MDDSVVVLEKAFIAAVLSDVNVIVMSLSFEVFHTPKDSQHLGLKDRS